MGWYYVITQEIRESFEGKEADVFAVINGYSQEGQGCFFGSLAQLSQFCGIKSKTTTQKILKSLLAKGAIVKGEESHNGVRFCTYKVDKDWYGMPKIDMGGISENDTNNKRDININNNSLYKGGGHFQKPSLDDIRAYCISRSNNVDPEQFFNFYESKGWMVGKTHMRDWRAAVRTWEKRENDSPRRRSPMTRSESVFEHNLKVVDQMFGTDYHSKAYGRKEVTADEQ